MTTTPSHKDLHREGFAIIAEVLAGCTVDALLAALDDAQITRLRRGHSIFGARNLLDVQAVRDLADAAAVRRLIDPILGCSARPVRALFFDKTPEANWPVLWHQDLSLAVAERHAVDGWGPWSTKAGIVHVQPPARVLEAMLAVRLHLDDCSTGNGQLRVLPGTHLLGRLSRERIKTLREEIGEVSCEAPAGAALLFRPLLLHASSPAKAPSHRRVLHFEFAPENVLPKPLAWAR
jgi:hypothetical protein